MTATVHHLVGPRPVLAAIDQRARHSARITAGYVLLAELLADLDRLDRGQRLPRRSGSGLTGQRNHRERAAVDLVNLLAGC